MPTIRGASGSIAVTFYSYPGNYPPLYYDAKDGSAAMASVNAGNSQVLDVDGGGVNAQFKLDLSSAGQKNISDYQGRHVKLLGQLDASGVASTSYANTDPTAFSYLRGIKLPNAAPGWYEGVCFVDVFDAGLCPNGNALNAAMAYAAPPYGGHYPAEADFLAAIEAMAINVVKTVAGYNVLATQQKLPVIQVLRSSLFSSGIFNPNGVEKEKIARAIYAGLVSALKIQSSGVVELQFPVSDDPKCPSYPGFAAVQQDLAGSARRARRAVTAPSMAPRAVPKVAAHGETEEPVRDWGRVEIPGGRVDAGKHLSTYSGATFDAPTIQKTIDKATDPLITILEGGGAVPATADFVEAEAVPVAAPEAVIEGPPVETASGQGGNVPVSNYGSSPVSGDYAAANSPLAGFDVEEKASRSCLSCRDDNGKWDKTKTFFFVITGLGVLGVIASTIFVIVLAAKNGIYRAMQILGTVADWSKAYTFTSLPAGLTLVAPIPAGWSQDAATGNVTFDPSKVSGFSATTPSVEAAYELGGDSTNTANLTINLVPPSTTPVAADVPAIVSDWSSPYTFKGLPSGLTLVAPIPPGWSQDSTTGNVTFAPSKVSGFSTSTPSAETAYELGGVATNKANLVINLVPQGTVADWNSGYTFGNIPAGFKLTGNDPNWELDPSLTTITFRPRGTVPAATKSVSTTYALGTESGTLTITLVPAMPVAATNIIAYVDSWTPFTFYYLPADFVLTGSDPEWTTGSSSGLANIDVTFTPASTNLPAAESINYRLKNDPAKTTENLIIENAPPASRNGKPAPIAISGASRVNATVLDHINDINNGSGSLDPTKSYVIHLSSRDDTHGTWNLDASQGTFQVVSFTPAPGVPVPVGGVSAQYQLVSTDGSVTSPAAPITISFSTAAAAADFIVTTSDLTAPTAIFFEDHWYSSVPFQSLTLDSTTQKGGGTWKFQAAQAGGRPTVQFVGSGQTGNVFSIQYTVTDSGGTAVSATMTVNLVAAHALMMPRAADVLYKVDPSQVGGKLAAVNALANSSSWNPKDPKSVVLLGLRNTGSSSEAPTALLGKGGKTLRVDGEGSWIVDDTGNIAFQGDGNLDHPPSPVVYGFADSKGYLSNPAMIVMDPAVEHIDKIKTNLAAQTDSDFWKNYYKTVIQSSDVRNDSTYDIFVTTTMALAEGTRILPDGVGPNPVSTLEYNLAYTRWVLNGQDWDELYKSCEILVGNATKGTTIKFAARYWRLNMMLRMVLGTLPAV